MKKLLLFILLIYGALTEHAFGQYCTPYSNSTVYMGISSVQFNTLNNVSNVNNSYTNYASPTTTVQTGSTYALNLTNYIAYSAYGYGYYAQYCTVWIDYNNNNVFESTELAVNNGYFYNTGSFNITIPTTGVVGGPTRMRIRTDYYGVYDPCATLNWGETEDYTITVNAGSALNFDGINDYVAITNPFYQFNKEITVEWWVNPASFEALGSGIGQSTVGIDQMASNVWLMHFNGSGTSMNFYVNDGGTWRTHGAVNIPTGWHHVAGVADATATKLYIDGALVSSGPGISGTILNNSISQMHFGKDVRFNANRFMTGSIDEVRIWNRALCIGEIQNNRNCEIPGAQSGLVGNYHFNQGNAGANNPTVTTLDDASGTGRSGTLYNMALAGSSSNWITPGGVLNGQRCSAYLYPEIDLLGNGISIADDDASPSLADNTDMGSSILNTNTKTFTIKNTGTGPLIVSNIYFAGTNAANFTTSGISFPATIGASGSQTFNITCNTPNLGIYTAKVTIDNNDCDEDVYRFEVKSEYSCQPASFSVCPGNIVVPTNSNSCNAVVNYNTASGGNPAPTLTYTFSGATSGSGSGNGSGSIFNKGVTNVTVTSQNACGTVNCNFTVTVNDLTPPKLVGSSIPTAAPALATSNVPEATDYKVVYELDIPVNANIDNGSFNYAVNNSSIPDVDINRVAYFMQIDNKWVWVSMDKFDPNLNLNQLSIPTASGNNVAWQQVVNNMNVFSSAGSGITNGTGLSGNIEMWHNCYNTGNTVPGIGGNGSTYDFNDLRTVSNPSCYGSFQVHNYNAQQTLFAYNAWDNPNNDELGIGNNTNGHPDWTFTYNAANYTTRKLYILVKAVTCLPDVVANAGTNCSAVVNYSKQATDNCGTATVSFNPPSGTSFNLGSTPVTITAIDGSGNSTTCNFNVLVVDKIAPSITCPANINVLATSAAGAIVNFVAPVGTDNCSGVSTIQTGGLASGSVFPIGTTIVNYRATDVAGNFTDCSFSVTVSGMAPSIVCPGPITVNSNATSCGAVVNYAATDNVGIPASTITYSIAPGSNFNLGTTQVTATATNAIGTSTCTFTVKVEDATAANVLTKNITVQLDASGNANITAAQINNGSTDNCGIANMSVSPSSFNCSHVSAPGYALNFNTGYTNGFKTYNNANIPIGNSARTFTAWIKPDGLPNMLGIIHQGNFDCNGYMFGIGVTGGGRLTSWGGCRDWASNLIVSANTWQHIAITYDGAGYVTLYLNGVGETHYVGSFNTAASKLFMGVETINNGASYRNSYDGLIDDVKIFNTSLSATQIAAEMNGTNPAIGNLVSHYPFNEGSGTNAADVVGSNHGNAFGMTASDWVVSTTPVFTGSGNNTVTLTVTDNSGNISSANALVAVLDKIAPNVITKNISINLNASGMVSIVAADVDNGSNDACGIKSMVVTPSNFTCSNIGANTVTLKVTDNNGNESSATATVTVNDITAPNAIAQNIPVSLDANGNASITAAQVNNGSTDACGIASMTLSKSTFDCSNVGANNVVLTVTDVNGNISTANAVVTVSDVTAPVATAQNIPVSLDANGNASITAAQVNNGSTDACGIASMTLSKSTFDCSNVGANNVVLTVTDLNGNISTANAVVTVSDVTAPVATAQNIPVNLDASGNASITAAQVNNGSTDACGIASMTLSKTTFDCSNVGANNVVLTVTDVNGNISTANAVVTVSDVTAPVATAQNIPVSLDANGNASITAAQVNNGSTDACGIASMTLSKSTFDCSNVGANNVVLTVTDVNGNFSTANAVVTVSDVTAPVATAQNIPVNLDASGNASITAAQVNNGSTDACGIASMTLSKSTFDCSNVGANNVVLTVTDVNGNFSTANAVVTVSDVTAPVANTQNVSVNLDASGNASITVAQVNNGSTDACGIASMTLNKTTFNCSNVGANNVVLTVTDVNGNVSTANAVITVADKVAPIALCQNVSATLVNGTATVSAAQVNNGSSDACGIATMTLSKTSFNCSHIGANSVILTVTDVNGNVSTCNATVTIQGVVPSCSISSAPNNGGTVIGSTTSLAAVNQMFLGYGAQSMNLSCTANGGGPFTYSWTGSGLSANNIANPVFTPTAGGNYAFTCTVTNSYGCQTTCTITICVLDVRASGGSPSNPKVYLCHLPPGNPNNSQTLNISVSAVPAHLTGHTGDRLGTCAQSCGSQKSNENIGDIYTDGDIDLIVYPNPSTGNFRFQLETISDEEVSISLFDVHGKLISESRYQTPQDMMVAGDQLANGMYIAVVKQGDFTKSLKIQKIQ